jgi:hypothetical protein
MSIADRLVLISTYKDFFETVLSRVSSLPSTKSAVLVLTSSFPVCLSVASQFRRFAPSLTSSVIRESGISEDTSSDVLFPPAEDFTRGAFEHANPHLLVLFDLPPAVPSFALPGSAKVLFSFLRPSAAVAAFAAKNSIPIDERELPPLGRRLHCLGCGGYYATDSTHTMSWLVPDLGIAFDAGSGTFRAFQFAPLPLLDVFLSHGHHDHISGFNLLERVSPRVRVHAQPVVIDFLRKMTRPPVVCRKIHFEACPIETCDPIHLENGAVITPFPVQHTSPCYGFRLEYDGHVMCYVTDTHSTAESEYAEMQMEHISSSTSATTYVASTAGPPGAATRPLQASRQSAAPQGSVIS